MTQDPAEPVQGTADDYQPPKVVLLGDLKELTHAMASGPFADNSAFMTLS